MVDVNDLEASALGWTADSERLATRAKDRIRSELVGQLDMEPILVSPALS